MKSSHAKNLKKVEGKEISETSFILDTILVLVLIIVSELLQSLI